MTNLTAKDLDVLIHILTGEEMACKKARMYSNTLTDAALAGEMEQIAMQHEQRFNALYAMIGGNK
ncbi:MAG: hypothetical protein IKD43_02005 [Clostridia bacterium]|nr:hypothetical protein [Clostridia bacterium]